MADNQRKEVPDDSLAHAYGLRAAAAAQEKNKS